LFCVNRDLNIVADANLRMRRHGAAIGVGQRYLALATFLEVRQQRAVTTTLLAQRLDLFSKILDARTVVPASATSPSSRRFRYSSRRSSTALMNFSSELRVKFLSLLLTALMRVPFHRQQLAPKA